MRTFANLLTFTVISTSVSMDDASTAAPMSTALAPGELTYYRTPIRELELAATKTNKALNELADQLSHRSTITGADLRVLLRTLELPVSPEGDEGRIVGYMHQRVENIDKLERYCTMRLLQRFTGQDSRSDLGVWDAFYMEVTMLLLNATRRAPVIFGILNAAQNSTACPDRAPPALIWQLVEHGSLRLLVTKLNADYDDEPEDTKYYYQSKVPYTPSEVAYVLNTAMAFEPFMRLVQSTLTDDDEEESMTLYDSSWTNEKFRQVILRQSDDAA